MVEEEAVLTVVEEEAIMVEVVEEEAMVVEEVDKWTLSFLCAQRFSFVPLRLRSLKCPRNHEYIH
jgi:hypothetical protein